MRIFNNLGKINFVDNNNVFVGYDMRGQCCEEFNWFIDNGMIDSNMCDDIEDYSGLQPDESDLELYVFDTAFQFYCDDYSDKPTGDYVGLAVFKLISDDKPNLYLHLYNKQNGFYSHGFEFKQNDNIIMDGEL